MSTRIADARKSIGMTQKALAEELGIAASTLNGYEKGNHKPDSEILIAVSNITGCTVDYLLGRVDGFHDFFKKEDSRNEPLESGQKEIPSAPAATGTERISIEETDKLLVALGFIEEGGELSDDDLLFLQGVVTLMNAWFGKRKRK